MKDQYERLLKMDIIKNWDQVRTHFKKSFLRTATIYAWKLTRVIEDRIKNGISTRSETYDLFIFIPLKVKIH